MFVLVWIVWYSLYYIESVSRDVPSSVRARFSTLSEAEQRETRSEQRAQDSRRSHDINSELNELKPFVKNGKVEGAKRGGNASCRGAVCRSGRSVADTFRVLDTHRTGIGMLRRAVLVALCGAWAALASLLPLDTEQLQASVGGYAVMNCHLDFPFGNEIPYHLHWDKDGETIFSWYSEERRARLADRWGGRVRHLSDGRTGLGRGSINVSAVRETDAGLYRCRVTFPNRTPPTRNNGTLYRLDVDGGNLILTPPMNATVLEGDRAELECMPKELGSTVDWYRDGTRLADLPELVARAELCANGSLVLRRASSSDPGEYECRVRDPADRVQSASAFLDVQYKAKVVYSPKERHFPYGKSASLDCHFSANPPLTNLRWEKDGFLFDPYNVPGVFYSRNGSLLFNQVDETHEGVYSCTPYNALGSEGASGGVRVLVQRPPALLARPQPLYVARLGATLTMPCTVTPHDHRDPPVLRWTRKDGEELPIGRHSLDEGNLTITDVSEEDRGVYICMASNEAAAVTVETELLIENVPPRAPYNLTATPSRHSLHVSWMPGYNGLEVDYNVWYRERTVSEWRTMKILTKGVTEATLVGLRPGTEYELRVLSQDLIGDGLFSKPIFVRTIDSIADVGGEAVEVVPTSTMAAENTVGQSAPVAAGTEIAAAVGDELVVSVQLIDEGALVRWQRDPADESRCTLRWYEETPGEARLLLTAHAHEDYALVGEAREGVRYWARVQCASGAQGGAALRVPEYSRLRGVAGGCAAGALLLAAAAGAVYAIRRRLCRGRVHKR